MKKVKSADARRAEIARAALELFTERGYQNTSVKDITERAGIAQGLFHYYFESKEAALAEVIGIYNDAVIERLNIAGLFPQDMRAIDKINKFLEIIFGHVNSRSDLFCEFSAMRDNVLANSIIARLVESCCGSLSLFIEQGNAEGVFNCPNPKLYSEIIAYGFVAHFRREMDKRGEVIEFSEYFGGHYSAYLDIFMRLLGMNGAHGLFGGKE